MTYFEFGFKHTNEYTNLKQIYENKNNFSNIKFNLFQGDITTGINWIWAENENTLNYFTRFLDSINIDKKLKEISNETFKLRGASFITIDHNIVNSSDFHYDVSFQYDRNDTDILTILFPLYELEEDMGHLEYKKNDETKIYTYDINKLIIWDSCKFLHRTQPYVITEPKHRILVSINLSTDKKWAVDAVNNCLRYQGNLLWID